ncbi:Histidine kinase-, DNA gyrase B-, and HSP90-like ATPase [Actinopolyspora alba]|uniref:histidine kinase n=2 Tax=Actinopolyspora alba TaxID=673379 RepID=A0A1I1Y3R5_9ACTN|nr:Histidine kinase-, DNA gyrase B-, and HSP90-like ATPase [Actinopolyspora alba]
MAGGNKGPDRSTGTGSAGSHPLMTGAETATASETGAPGEAPAANGSSGPVDDHSEERPSGGLRMRNWRLRTKLLVVLLVPALAALVFGALQVVSDYNQTQQLLRMRQQVTLDTRSAEVVHELQRERDLTVAYIAAGRGGERSQLTEQRDAVDAAIERFRSAIDEAKQQGNSTVATPYEQAVNRLDRLQALRTVTDETAYPAKAALRAYSASVDNLIALGERAVTRINNESVVRLYRATNALSRVKEQESVKRARLLSALESGEFGIGGQRQLLATDASMEAALDEFRKRATNAQIQRYNDTVSGLAVGQARDLQETAIVQTQQGEGLSGINAQEWMRTATQTVNLTYQVESELRQQLQNQADQLAGAARTQTYVVVVLVLLVLVVAFAIALLVARSLLLPLRTLRRSALNVADNRLPEAVESILEDENPDLGERSRIDPIPVHTTEEIGRVARSFDAVHAQALRLASEQALLRNNVNDLFVNLARRSQTLVQRQLSLIDRLEQDEQDPDQLSQLFELDHLATRMRRNNENLLILGGTDLTRRTVRPVPLSEVIGASVSEVEQYARVVIGETPELAMQGRVVNDIVHLIAELLENATVYSNPDTEVTVRTAYRRQELVLEIRDRGVGVDAEQLDEINDRLVRPPDIDVAVSRRMGLYVVGQLARRHHVTVELQNNGDLEGGATATVRLPGELIVQLTPNGPMPMPDMPREQSRDGMGETGSNSGLAAAFGGADRSAQLEQPQANNGYHQQFPSNSPELDERDAVPDSPAALEAEPTTRTPWPEEQPEPWSPDSEPPETPSYSVRLSSGETYGVTEVPRWEHDSGSRDYPDEPEHRRDERPTMDWPGPADSSRAAGSDFQDEYEGQCAVPPGLEDSPDLFHSPFESEKTEQHMSWPGPAPEDEPAGAVPPAAAGDTGITEQVPAVGLGSGSGGPEMDDTPTERLPIYEAVLSQWFREDDGEPAASGRSTLEHNSELPSDSELVDDAIGWPGRSTFTGDHGGDSRRNGMNHTVSSGGDLDAGVTGGESWNGSQPSARDSAGQREPASRPAEPEGHERRVPHEEPGGSAPAPEPGPATDSGGSNSSETAMSAFSGRRAANREERNRVADARQSGEDPGWGAGDAGWEAAEALVQQTEQEQEQTAAGLPKRRPKSNLVPGSATEHQSPPPSKPAVPRSASAVRGRMSNFQQGVRRGRHAKVEPESTEQSRSIPSRPEEQE